jgi:hypothetical protein
MSAPKWNAGGNHTRTRSSRKQDLELHKDPNDEVSNAEQEYDRSQRLYVVMTQIANWDHGYLKLKRDTTGSDLHITWTWTLTRAAGSYVYVRCNFWELDFGLDTLVRKILAVDEGMLKPTPDKRNPFRQ